MKKISPFTKIIISLAFITLVLLSSGNKAQATVGGPTFIYDFKYNSANESVYYTRVSLSGRGCPPELLRLSLKTGLIDTVYSCDQGEKALNDNAVNAEINKITANFKNLTPINLTNNNISIDVNFLRTENFNAEINEVLRSYFSAVIYQNQKKTAEFPITGCDKNQPFTFEGYAIPGFNKKIILLLSTKGDCFEGGYIVESLHIVGGVDNLNKTAVVGFPKTASALAVTGATLTVLESQNITNQNTSTNKPASTPAVTENNDPQKNAIPTPILLGSGIIAILLGIFLLGKFFLKKPQQNIEPKI